MSSLLYVSFTLIKLSFKNVVRARPWWLTLVILNTQEADMRKIAVQSLPREIVCETLSQKNTS
jgi:hypothetical protein